MVSVLAFLGCVWLFSVISYLLYYFFNAWVTAKPKDVKGMYGGVEWALVTGGSSGIGAALSEELCQQGINVVIVAKKDAMLEETTSRLEKDFPERRIVSVGVDLGDSNGSYMKAIKEATEELPIKVVINNAGYIRVGHFINDPCEAALHNNEVNVISALRYTHLSPSHFQRKKKAASRERKMNVIFDQHRQAVTEKNQYTSISTSSSLHLVILSLLPSPCT